ncbi:MAG: hypothetical protein WC967_04050 [Balneolaceae bacterium]
MSKYKPSNWHLLIIVAVILSNLSCAKSTKQNNNEYGVLVLAHGSNNDSWDNSIHEVIKSVEDTYPTQVAFGMADPSTMQPAIDSLEQSGVKKIVVVQLFISSHSPIIRQNEYLLGLRDSLADAPMLMMHHTMVSKDELTNVETNSAHAEHGMDHNSDGDTELKQLNINAKILLTDPLDDHALVAGILLDRINALSHNPAKETILIVAHGPNGEQDNQNWVKSMENLANQIEIQAKEKNEYFKNIEYFTVRDDADADVYEKAKQHFRNAVIDANKDGEAIVIPLLLAQGGVEARYVKRLEGLTYKWSGETLLPHANISKFVELAVHNAINN